MLRDPFFKGESLKGTPKPRMEEEYNLGRRDYVNGRAHSPAPTVRQRRTT